MHRPAARFDSRRTGGWRSCYLDAVWARAVGSGVTASETLISGGRERQFVDQVLGAAFDVVADGAYGWGVEASGVVEVVPGFRSFAGDDVAGIAAAHGDHDVGGADGFVGPGFGNSLEMSMPRSAMAAIAAGLTSCPGSDRPTRRLHGRAVRASKNPRAI